MKPLKKMYGIPITIFLIIIGISIISFNPIVNKNGGFDIPKGARTVSMIAGVGCLLVAGYLAINTLKKKNR